MEDLAAVLIDPSEVKAIAQAKSRANARAPRAVQQTSGRHTQQQQQRGVIVLDDSDEDNRVSSLAHGADTPNEEGSQEPAWGRPLSLLGGLCSREMASVQLKAGMRVSCVDRIGVAWLVLL